MGPRPLTGGRVRRVSTWSAAGSARARRYRDAQRHPRVPAPRAGGQNAIHRQNGRSAVRAGESGGPHRRQVAGSDPGSQPAEREPMFTFGLMVRIGTALGPGAVRDALTALRGRYPTLEAADDDLPFPLVVRRSATASTWVEVAEAGLAEPFGPTDAHVRLTMLRIGPVTDLVLICD